MRVSIRVHWPCFHLDERSDFVATAVWYNRACCCINSSTNYYYINSYQMNSYFAEFAYFLTSNDYGEQVSLKFLLKYFS